MNGDNGSRLDVGSLISRAIRNKEQRLLNMLNQALAMERAKREREEWEMKQRERQILEALAPQIYKQRTGMELPAETPYGAVEPMIKAKEAERTRVTAESLLPRYREEGKKHRIPIPTDLTAEEEITYWENQLDIPRRKEMYEFQQQMQQKYTTTGLPKPMTAEQKRQVLWGGDTRKEALRQAYKDESYIKAKEKRTRKVQSVEKPMPEDINNFYNALINEMNLSGQLTMPDIGKVSKATIIQMEKRNAREFTDTHKDKLMNQFNTLGQIYRKSLLQLGLLETGLKPQTFKPTKQVKQPENIENLINRAEQGDISAYRRLKELGYIK